MSDPFFDNPVPRKPLIAIWGLVLFSLLLVVTAKLTGYNPKQMPDSPVVESRDLRFVDAADGTLVVEDAVNGQHIAVLPAGNQGFVRGVLRALARDRRARHLGPETPYRVARLADGRLILRDLGTERVIELNSFGPTNYGAFAAYLEHSPVLPVPPAQASQTGTTL